MCGCINIQVSRIWVLRVLFYIYVIIKTKQKAVRPLAYVFIQIDKSHGYYLKVGDLKRFCVT